jgi:hypothetical protein
VSSHVNRRYYTAPSTVNAKKGPQCIIFQRCEILLFNNQTKIMFCKIYIIHVNCLTFIPTKIKIIKRVTFIYWWSCFLYRLTFIQFVFCFASSILPAITTRYLLCIKSHTLSLRCLCAGSGGMRY